MTGVAELECRTLNLGDSLKVWKNGTRVISVGSLQVRETLGWTSRLENSRGGSNKMVHLLLCGLVVSQLMDSSIKLQR